MPACMWLRIESAGVDLMCISVSDYTFECNILAFDWYDVTFELIEDFAVNFECDNSNSVVTSALVSCQIHAASVSLHVCVIVTD